MQITHHHRYGILFLLVLSGYIGVPEPAVAQSYSVIKTIEWNISAGRNRMRGGPNSGEMQYLVRVFAEDKHKKQIKEVVGNKRNPAFLPDLTYDLVESNQANGRPVKKTFYWKKKNFDQAKDPNKIVTLYDSGEKKAKSTHPTSTAMTKMWLSKAWKDRNQQWFRSGSIQIKGSAKVKKIPQNHAPETAYAEAASGGFLKLTGEVEAIHWNQGEKHGDIKVTKAHRNGVRVSGIAQEGDAQGGINQINHSQVSDPIHMSFTDMGTGQLLGSQDVFYDLWLASGNAEVEWTVTDGLTLLADVESTAAITYETLSDWITNPLDGQVVLSEGVLEASGVFADMPWELSVIDGMYRAWLAPDQFTPEYAFEYDVSSLADSVGNVLAEISVDQAGFASAYDTVVPSPGSAWLIVMGTVSAFRRRRSSLEC